MIINAYLLYKRRSLLGEIRDVHEFLNWDSVVMTDSGGYQILEYGDVEVRQEEILAFQKSIKSDIGVILDVPTGDVPRLNALKSVKITLERARAALNIINPEEDEVLWVLPLQGGRHLDLLEYSAKESSKLPYLMYAIGSPTVFLEEYKYEVITDMIYTAKRVVDHAKPMHLFGAGHPIIFPLAIALGVDTFDSASYIFYARDDRYMTETGVYRLEELEYFPCSCPICSKYTPHDLMEMSKEERKKLLAIHNLYTIKKAIDEAKQAIREGRLWELLERVARSHPGAYRALLRFRKYHKYLSTWTPRTKVKVKGLRTYGKLSLWNPKLIKFRARVLSKYMRSASKIFKNRDVILEPLPKDLSNCKYTSNPYRLYYAPYVGVIPSELCGVYPSIHVDYDYSDVDVINNLVNTLVATLIKLQSASSSIEVRIDNTILFHELTRKLSGKLPVKLVLIKSRK